MVEREKGSDQYRSDHDTGSQPWKRARSTRRRARQRSAWSAATPH